MSKTIYQNFYLPKFLKHNWEQLSYGSVVFQVEQHALQLDKQVFCSEILQLFHNYPELISFNFIAKEIGKVAKHNDNEYEPLILEPSYEFSIHKTIWTNNKEYDNLLFTLSSFENYVSSHSQFKIVYWLLKTAKEANLFCQFNGQRFEFLIDKSFIQMLSQDAYGEHFSQFFYQALEQNLNNNKVCSTKSKI